MKIFTGFSVCLAMLISPVAFSYEPDVWLTDLIHGSTVYQIENSSIKFHMECNTGGNGFLQLRAQLTVPANGTGLPVFWKKRRI